MLMWIMAGLIAVLAVLLTFAVWMLIDFAKAFTWHNTKGGW